MRLLDRLLLPTDLALEFGCGRSTSWLARRVRELISTENSVVWHARTCATLEAKGIRNCELRLVVTPEPLDEEVECAAYLEPLQSRADESVDVIVIDGGA